MTAPVPESLSLITQRGQEQLVGKQLADAQPDSAHAMRPLILPRLLLVTDRSQLPTGTSLASTVWAGVEAGLRAVVVREHDLAPLRRHALLSELAAIPGLLVITSRIPDPAAAGTHLATGMPAPRDPASGGPASGGPASGGPASGGPALWGASGGPALWGRSCHARAEVVAAASDGATYVTLSPYAESRSKPGYGPALTPGAYGGHAIPVFALGGVDADNAERAIAAGAYGVAVMGSVMRAARPAAVVAELLRRIEAPSEDRPIVSPPVVSSPVVSPPVVSRPS